MAVSPTWLAAASAAAAWVARHHKRFTTDEVWERLKLSGLLTPDHRAMGGVMRDAAKAGLCVSTGEWRESSRLACHHRYVRVWRSLVF